MNNKPAPNVNYLVSHEHKVIYLSIPKNANSYLKALFVKNNPNAREFDPSNETADQYMARVGRGQFRLDNTKMLRDPNYTKLVVLRDPLARLVSAYLDKIIKKIHIKKDDRPDEVFYNAMSVTLGRRIQEESITFEDFVEYLARSSDRAVDKHYRSQKYFTGATRFNYYGIVEHMSGVLSFLGDKGFDTTNFAARSLKRTSYDLAGKPKLGYHPARAYPAMLNAEPQYPSPTVFFDRRCLERAVQAYGKDLDLYCWARGMGVRELIQNYCGSAE